MAHACRASAAASDAGMDAQTVLLDGGTIEIYDGTQPATPDIAITSQTRLAVLTFSAPAFAPAVSGVAVANAIGASNSNEQTGTARWARLRGSSGTAVFDVSVGLSDCDIVLDSVSIQQAGTCALSSLSLTLPQA